MVAECKTALCGWTYSFSNFAHDGDASLALMGGDWTGVRGLSAACYYLHPNADDPRFCAAMNQAHAQWAAVYGEDDWQQNGQGGATGYQIISMIKKALIDAGRDLTRERFVAAIRAYDGYADLITSPITFAGSSNYAHGAEKMVVYEGQVNQRYAQITDGFVEY